MRLWCTSICGYPFSEDVFFKEVTNDSKLEFWFTLILFYYNVYVSFNYPINAWALLVPNCFTILINYRNILPKIMIISGILSLLTSAIIIIMGFIGCRVLFDVCGESFSWDLQASHWLISNLSRSYVLLGVFLMPCRVLYVMSCFTCIVAVM